jgi:uncharacterized Fe-S cluster protein YjdI
MLRDVFYYGQKPNAHPREKFAQDINDARRQSTTEHFWIINEFCDYTRFDWDFDFEFLHDNDVWAESHNNVWPSKYQKDSGTWLCAKENSAIIIYRNDVDIVPRKPVTHTYWQILSPIDESTFDFGWHPDPTDSPYIYVWGNQWYPGTIMPTVEYHVDGATQRKYIESSLAILAQQPNSFEVFEDIGHFDYSWVPNPTSPPYIYAWGNQWNDPEDKVSVQYAVDGGTEYKFMHNNTTRKPCMDNWEVPTNIDIDNFDFSWEPSPAEPPFIYQFGTQHQKTGGPRYVVEGATEVKYLDILKTKALPSKENWSLPNNIDIDNFDFSWHPDDTSPPYIYYFATQWALSGGPIYTVPDATEVKYVEDIQAKALPNKSNWEVPAFIDSDSFDFSWHPYVEDEPYIYQFGTQHQKTGGPKYITPGSHKNSPVKYIDTRILKAKRLPSKQGFTHVNGMLIEDFDYSWHPDTTEEPYIYKFGSQWYSAEIFPAIEYIVPGATQIKYVTDIIATLAPNKQNWIIPDDVQVANFDFSWVPNPHDPPYIYRWGNKYISNKFKPTIEYHVPDATDIKYMDDNVEVLPEWDRWKILQEVDKSSFDFSWRPDPLEPPFIYVWGNKYVSNKFKPTLEYHVPGATDIKYMDDSVEVLPEWDRWEIPDNIDATSFDFSWRPDPLEPDLIWQFGTQWQRTGGPRYIAPGATEIKYIDTLKARRLPSPDNWEMPEKVKIAKFDTSWHPDATDGAYIYQFGTQWVLTGGPRYVVPGATEVKFVEENNAIAAPDHAPWITPSDIDGNSFDYSWHPHPDDPPFVYQFGTQWQKTSGPKYIAEGAVDGETSIKYIDTRILKARRLPSRNNWVIENNIDVSTFDFSWHPDANAPNYIYQFGTLSNDTDGPRYEVPNNNGEIVFLERTKLKDDEVAFPHYFIETTLDELVNKHPKEVFWALNPDIDYSAFDFTWRPSIEQARYVHAFGSEDNINTQTYFVSGPMWHQGYRDINYVEKKVEISYVIDLFFVDRGNKEATSRFEKLKQQFGNRIQKTRYLNSWVDTINRCINRSSSNLCWILNSELDYTGFDFKYYPNSWQMNMVHVFGTQWSHWGTTFMVNRDSFAKATKYVKIIEHLSNLNFVKERTSRATNCLYDVFLVDHGNRSVTKVLRTIQSRVSSDTPINLIKYSDSYFETFNELLKTLPDKKEHYVWICSSVCDYSKFDFSYICDPYAKEQLHVFPSDKQKFGDTFLVNVNKLRELIADMSKLEEYTKINYNQHQRVARLPAPSIVTEGDTHVSSINTDFDFPYAIFTTNDNTNNGVIDIEPMSLWAPDHKNIIVTTTGATRIIAPKEIKDYVKRELYDYPYIKTNSKLGKSTPMDIVFLSNGETGADANYEHLLRVTHGLANRVVRVDGVNGRVQAYHAAADASNTPWMFTVFAKLKVSNKFDWNWQPDRMQLPKHYVFHAKNPVNGLVYGHQAMIAYNKKITLKNNGKGLDFTMDDEHEIVPLLSGVANFNTDIWSTWRTSFREVVKLKSDTTDESKERLNVWMTQASGEHSEWCLRGAQDASEYFDSVGGDFFELRDSYEWAWLKNRFSVLYPDK